MSLDLLSISSMYPGSLESFYYRFREAKEMRYNEHYNLLMNETTEFTGSYYRHFKKLGLNAKCIIANDYLLQDKWAAENGFKGISGLDLICRQIEIWKPEIIWIEDINRLSRKWIDELKKKFSFIKLVGAYHCSPFNRELLNKIKGTDFLVTCTPGLRMSMEREGIRSYLVYHGFDTGLVGRFKRENRLPDKDVVFSGSLFTGGGLHSARINLIEKVLADNIGLELYVNLENRHKIWIKQGFSVVSKLLKRLGIESILNGINVIGYSAEQVTNYSEALRKASRKPLFGTDMYDLFAGSRIVLNFHIGTAGEYAGNMRLFEVTGAGSCLLTDNKKNIADLFTVGKEIVVYDSPEECIEKIKWLLDHEDERRAIALAGHLRTLKDHTVENRCRQIMEIFNSELKNR